jgi:peroxiredoxin
VTTSVQGLLDELQAGRDAEWSADRLAEHAAFRRSLADNADWSAIVAPGDVVPATAIDLDALLDTGPAVLIFFRFESCPACNAALRGYHLSLAPALAELGAHLIAVSAQTPEKLRAIKHRQGFDFAVASDVDHALIDALGIGFDSPGAGDILGVERSTLPYPSVIVIDRGRVARFVDVRPDWMARTEAGPVIDAVRTIGAYADADADAATVGGVR